MRCVGLPSAGKKLQSCGHRRAALFNPASLCMDSCFGRTPNSHSLLPYSPAHFLVLVNHMQHDVGCKFAWMEDYIVKVQSVGCAGCGLYLGLRLVQLGKERVDHCRCGPAAAFPRAGTTFVARGMLWRWLLRAPWYFCPTSQRTANSCASTGDATSSDTGSQHEIQGACAAWLAAVAWGRCCCMPRCWGVAGC